MNTNLPKFAKFSSFGDKGIICEVCCVSVKNLNVFNFKHVRSEEHINNVKKFLMREKEKTIEGKEDKINEKKFVNQNKNSFSNSNIKNNNINNNKKINDEINNKKNEIIKENLLNYDKETIDDNNIDLPKGFFDEDIKKDKIEKKETKKDNNEVKIENKKILNNNKKKIEPIMEIDKNYINKELIDEAEEMIKNSQTLIQIMENYKKKKEKEKKFLSKKRNLNDINENNNETKENLLDDILN